MGFREGDNSNHRTHGCGTLGGKSPRNNTLTSKGKVFKPGIISCLHGGHCSRTHGTSDDFDAVISHSAGNTRTDPEADGI